jgi:hypothetical protein
MRAYRSSFSALAVTVLMVGCADPASIVIEPLRVINWSPAGGGFCVDIGATVSATFSDDLTDASLSDANFYLQGAAGDVPATLEYDKLTYTIRLKPTDPLAFDALFTAIATSGITGREQGRLAVQIDASFTTIKRNGCTPGVECSLPSDCPGTQICANIGVCRDECVTDKDCYHGTCAAGACVPNPHPHPGGGGDAASGDP